MEHMHPDDQSQFGGNPPPNSLDGLVKQQDFKRAIDEENQKNFEEADRSPERYEDDTLGAPPPPEPDYGYDDFLDTETVQEEKKIPFKKYNDSKKAILKKNAKITDLSAQNEKLAMQAELDRKEIVRLRDVSESLALLRERDEIETRERIASDEWALAHQEGDIELLKKSQQELSEHKRLKSEIDYNLSNLVQKYQQYQQDEEAEQEQRAHLENLQNHALLDFFDRRELESPHSRKFLDKNSFLDPQSPDYDPRIADRVKAIKDDFNLELKLNNQATHIATEEFYAELTDRMHEKLNPRRRGQQPRRQQMSNQYDPHYQYPQNNPQNNTQNHQNQHQQNYQPQYQYPQHQQQQPHAQQGYAPAPQSQQHYQQPQYQYPQNQAHNQSYVAPVNRAGYQTNYVSDARDIALTDQQREAASMLSGVLNDLSRHVHGKGMDQNDVEHSYKQGLMKQGGY